MPSHSTIAPTVSAVVISATRPGYISPRNSAIDLSKLTHAISTAGMTSDIAGQHPVDALAALPALGRAACADDSGADRPRRGGSWNVVKNETPNRYATTPSATSENRIGP